MSVCLLTDARRAFYQDRFPSTLQTRGRKRVSPLYSPPQHPAWMLTKCCKHLSSFTKLLPEVRSLFKNSQQAEEASEVQREAGVTAPLRNQSLPRQPRIAKAGQGLQQLFRSTSRVFHHPQLCCLIKGRGPTVVERSHKLCRDSKKPTYESHSSRPVPSKLRAQSSLHSNNTSVGS